MRDTFEHRSLLAECRVELDCVQSFGPKMESKVAKLQAKRDFKSVSEHIADHKVVTPNFTSQNGGKKDNTFSPVWQTRSASVLFWRNELCFCGRRKVA